jgi:hypothetical protein
MLFSEQEFNQLGNKADNYKPGRIDVDYAQRATKGSLVNLVSYDGLSMGVNDGIATVLGAHPKVLRLHEQKILPRKIVDYVERKIAKLHSFKEFHITLAKRRIVQPRNYLQSVELFFDMAMTSIPITPYSGYKIVIDPVECGDELESIVFSIKPYINSEPYPINR